MYHHELLIAALSQDHRARLERYAEAGRPAGKESRRRRLRRTRRAPQLLPDN
jgi:hypothetical protein